MRGKQLTVTKGLQPPLMIFGMRVARVTMSQGVETVLDWCEDPGPDGPRTIFTANPEMLWSATRCESLRRALTAASLVVADGVGVVLASRILGRPVPQRLAGIDFLGCLLSVGQARHLCPYFLGGRPEVIARLPGALKAGYPGLSPAGFHHGYFPLGDRDYLRDLWEDIGRSGANLLVTGMGVPRDQVFLSMSRGRLPGVGAALGVGGSFDVLTGSLPRAPTWMQRAGLEWFYRLLLEPSRLPRQVAIPAFLVKVLVQAVRERLSREEGDGELGREDRA